MNFIWNLIPNTDGYFITLILGAIMVFFFLFGHAAQLVGSQFPDQGLNLGHSSESTEF